MRLRAQLARAGLHERAQGAGIVGAGAPETQVRGSLALLLAAGAAFVLGGVLFAKASEHFAAALPPADRLVPRAAFDTVWTAAITAGVLVVVGAAAALPGLVAVLRAGGWSSIRRPVYGALGATVVSIGALLALLPWAHSLTQAQR